MVEDMVRAHSPTQMVTPTQGGGNMAQNAEKEHTTIPKVE